MSRKVKNMIMISIILIVCVLSYFTMIGAVKGSIPNNSRFEKEFDAAMPQFNNSEFSKEDIPEKPSGDFVKGQMPNIGELPENFEKGEMHNLDEIPEDFQENFNGGRNFKGQFKQNINAIYYILFAVEGLTISLLLIYLIMSRFNSKILKETLGTGKLKIIFVILVLVLTIGLTVAQTMLAKNIFAANDMTQFENMQGPRNDTNNLNNTNEINEVENI